jgi:hypothetical protein
MTGTTKGANMKKTLLAIATVSIIALAYGGNALARAYPHVGGYPYVTPHVGGYSFVTPHVGGYRIFWR